MAYEVWPTAINAPDTGINVKETAPLVSGNEKAIGRHETARIKTRPVVKASATLLLDSTEFQTFLVFWRDTLDQGKQIFSADWIADAGYPYYVARITAIQATSNGVVPKIALSFDLIPDIRLDAATGLVPDVWPPL